MEEVWLRALAVIAGLLLIWTALIVALWFGRPDQMSVREALRLLPDLVRMLRRLAADNTLPRGVRWRIWFLIGYLAMPLDLIPDFVPVLGQADDAIMVALVLRSVARRAGAEALERHWPGTPTGFAALRRLVG